MFGDAGAAGTALAEVSTGWASFFAQAADTSIVAAAATLTRCDVDFMNQDS
jgi:hypothetical protein